MLQSGVPECDLSGRKEIALPDSMYSGVWSLPMRQDKELQWVVKAPKKGAES
jgi:hypothetical protein